MPDSIPTLDVEGRRRAMGVAIRNSRGDRTQAELGKLLGGLAQATISAWEKGVVDLTCEQVRAVELALDLKLGSLAAAAGYTRQQESTLAADDEIMTLFVHDMGELRRTLRSANHLGLGVRVENRWVPTPDDDGAYEEEWVIQLTRVAPGMDD